jgi:uncharacterized protein (TIGR02145 family)
MLLIKKNNLKEIMLCLLIIIVSMLFFTSCSYEKDYTPPNASLSLYSYDSLKNICTYALSVSDDEGAVKSIVIYKGNSVIYQKEVTSRSEITSGSTVFVECTYTSGYKIRAIVTDFGENTTEDTLTQSKTNINNSVSTDSVTDIDGNVYQTVQIGTQVWTVENLRVTKYNDGTSIPHVTDSATWSNLTTPGYCFYNNSTDIAYQCKWGALYNWYAVNTGKLAPTGWHVPTDSEWEVMQSYLVMHDYNYDGTTDTANNKIAMALAAKTDWRSYTKAGCPGNNLTQNNSSGFSALPGGCREPDGSFDNIGSGGLWWSATESDASSAWGRYLHCDYDYLYRYYYYKGCGFSVRLVRDSN